MDKNNPLAQLRDIHLPPPISWWPPAPGWWILAIFLCLLIAFLIYHGYQRYNFARAKKQALKLLRDYQQQYARDHDGAIASASISELLRRVALVYYPRAQVASLHGEAWLSFLNQTSSQLDFNEVKELLLDAPFMPNHQLNLQPLFQIAKHWIKQRGMPCLN